MKALANFGFGFIAGVVVLVFILVEPELRKPYARHP